MTTRSRSPKGSEGRLVRPQNLDWIQAGRNASDGARCTEHRQHGQERHRIDDADAEQQAGNNAAGKRGDGNASYESRWSPAPGHVEEPCAGFVIRPHRARNRTPMSRW